MALSSPQGSRDSSRTSTSAGPAFGMFHQDLAAKRMCWNDELYPIFGFEMGQVVPTFALMVSHVHRDDRQMYTDAFAAIAQDGSPFSRWHRIVDARGHLRNLLTNGLAERDEDGSIRVVRGWTIDLTERVRENLAPEIDEAVARSAETRAVIDEAKGILMAVLDVDDKQSFALLKWHSSHANKKLRDVAVTLSQRFTDTRMRRLAPKERVSAIFSSLLTPVNRSTRRGESFVSAPRLPTVSNRVPAISSDQLPGTMLHAVAVAKQSITISDVRLPDAPLVYVNKAFETLTGYPSTQTMGKNCRFLQGPDTTDEMTADIRHAIGQEHEIRTVLRNYRKDGSPFWNELHLSPVHDATGTLTHYIGYQSDVTERVERELALASLAFTDPLTNLPNEAAATEYVESMTLSANPAETLTVWHLGVPRIDFVSAFSDHSSALTEIASQLQEILPAGAYLAKLSDDAFLVAASRLVDDEALDGTIRRPIVLSPSEPALGLQVGRASWPTDAAEAQDVIDAARAAARYSSMSD